MGFAVHHLGPDRKPWEGLEQGCAMTRLTTLQSHSGCSAVNGQERYKDRGRETPSWATAVIQARDDGSLVQDGRVEMIRRA